MKIKFYLENGQQRLLSGPKIISVFSDSINLNDGTADAIMPSFVSSVLVRGRVNINYLESCCVEITRGQVEEIQPRLISFLNVNFGVNDED